MMSICLIYRDHIHFESPNDDSLISAGPRVLSLPFQRAPQLFLVASKEIPCVPINQPHTEILWQWLPKCASGTSASLENVLEPYILSPTPDRLN